MPTDDIVWNPRIGAVGDQKYDFPGSSLMAGGTDPGSPTRIDAGSSAGYSPTFNPTLAQLQAAASITMNQIIGLINNRITNINTTQSLSQPTSTYANSVPLDDISIQRFILDLRSQIDFIRLHEGSTAFSWDTDFVALGASTLTTVKGYHLAEMRKALQRFLNIQNFADTFNFNAPTVTTNKWPKNINVLPFCDITHNYHWDTSTSAFIDDGYTFSGVVYLGTGAFETYAGNDNVTVTKYFFERSWTSVRILPTNINPFTNSSPSKLTLTVTENDFAGVGPAGMDIYYLIQPAAGNMTATSKTGNATYGSRVITNTTVTAATVAVNDLVSGPGIPQGSFVTARTIGAAGSITINVPLEASGVGITYTLNHYANPTPVSCTLPFLNTVYNASGMTFLGNFQPGTHTINFFNLSQNDIVELHCRLPSGIESGQMYYDGTFHAILNTCNSVGTIVLQTFYT